MSQQLVVGNISKGLTTNPLAFNIDNDAFPILLNAYQWRGRVKRKRGTFLLGRLTRFFDSTKQSYTLGGNVPYTITLSGGAANLLTGTYTNTDIPPKTFTLQVTGNIVPGSITIVDTTAAVTYTEPATHNGTLVGGLGGTINYATGDITLVGGAAHLITASFLYTPDLPVMGLEDLNLNAEEFPGTIAFDTKYSYNITTAQPYTIYDVSFYKNPPVDPVNLPGYIQKTNVTPTSWNGQDYQQFWTTNYQGAFWATNGINVPFSITNIGMQFNRITNISMIVAGPPATIRLTITGHGLVVGDFLFINEVPTTSVTGINFQTGYVINVVDANNVDVEFPNATLAGAGGAIATGIAQYLTNRSDITKDCLRWYDGDPTNGNATTPTLNGNLGWVNFAPPLSNAIFQIGDLPPKQYYLVGARVIVPFKDRLLFFGPVIQTSSAGSQVYLQDTVIFSQNGTPFYTASFTPLNAGTYPNGPYLHFSSVLVPVNQTATPNAYFGDVTGFGGFITDGIAQPIISVSPNEDVLIVGFTNRQKRFVYTGNDLVPFNFFTINSEFGSGATFSAVTFDRGVLTFGNQGIIQTAQISSQRVDLQIPDQIFEFNLINNGFERVAAQRDFINEWVYFSYSTNMGNDEINTNFPNQTLQYNYRDETWAIFNESYTTYGRFRSQNSFTWNTIGIKYKTWNTWDDPWDSGNNNPLQPQVIAGNQQGFVLFRGIGTDEDSSLYIQSISGNNITSPLHNLNEGDFIIIEGAIGSIGLNGLVWRVGVVTPNTFIISTVPPRAVTGTYVGGGVITRLYIPNVLTKQFPMAWGMGRKTRIGAQRYLLSTTENGQITLNIYLSQNQSNSYNDGNIVPAPNSFNNGLVYSSVLYTCPESTNIGLTPANTNLQMVNALEAGSEQIWHRMNTSLIGDTVQVGFTLSSESTPEVLAQMFTYTIYGTKYTITNITQAYPCVITANNTLSAGQLVQITGVVGMTQLNGNIYNVISATPTTISIDVNSTSFTPYASGGIVNQAAAEIQTAEIELHGFVINVTPSQMLA